MSAKYAPSRDPILTSSLSPLPAAVPEEILVGLEAWWAKLPENAKKEISPQTALLLKSAYFTGAAMSMGIALKNTAKMFGAKEK